MSFLSTSLGDITRLKVDVIVNAANETLLGGGGVDGAIHRAAGPQLLEHCRKLGGCEIGQVKITPGFELPAKWIIHTVAPRWIDGQNGESALLTSCYRKALKLAAANSLRTIAFPCIGTGAYGYPLRPAAEIAVETVRAFMEEDGSLTEIIFCCFTREEQRVYEALLATE